ncbi:MAG: lipoprotein-releasing system permease protein [Alteromonas naphthalenivorans]|jgi:lipoprotein-releasing system permease protein
MSLSIATFLAWRYAKQAIRQSTLQTMLWICFGSIFVGTFSLALIVSIMSGFESETQKKLQGIYPDIIIESPTGTFLDAPPLIKHLKKNFSTIAHTCTYSSQQVLIQAPHTQEPTIVGILKGITPEEERVTNLHTKYQLAPNVQLKGPHVIIGKTIAETLNKEVGETITLLYSANPHAQLNNIRFSSLEVTIAGLISTGMTEYDNALVIAHQGFVTSLFEEECINQVGVKLTNPIQAQHIAKQCATIPELHAYRWQDLYPSLVSALKLEKYAMFFILGLIVLVASMNNISLLFMFITAKRKEIALLKMLGMNTRTVMLIFLFFNLFITCIATLFGLACAYGVGRLLQRYPFIELPDVYYISHLPVHLDPYMFLTIFILVLVLGILSALLPLFSIKKINITQTLRFE